MKTKRLYFVDALRGFAMLMMLQGHFIGLSYNDFNFNVNRIKNLGASGSYLFDFWYFTKGNTAPLFFFVTGLIFTFLLLRQESLLGFKNRILKGVKRSLELLFYGYILQLSLINISNTFVGEYPWIFAFHVLQSIGLSILLLILFFRVHRLIPIFPIGYLFVLAGLLSFISYGLMKSFEGKLLLLESCPQILQNIVNGPNSIFPIIPWVGYVFFGGATGFFIHKYRDEVFSFKFSATILLISFFLINYNYLIYNFFNYFFETTGLNVLKSVSLYKRLGYILFSLVIFIRLEFFYKSNIGRTFVEIGRKTLFIYTWHVIILYGGIFGIGLNKLIENKLNIYQSVFGSLVFITFFILFSNYSQYFDHCKEWVVKLIKGQIKSNFIK